MALARAIDPQLLRRMSLAEAGRRRLATFSRAAWPVLEPETPLAWGDYHDVICLHLEAVTAGTIQNLIINVPPGSTKSVLCCVMWPSWVWLRRPAWRAMFASYGAHLSYRDSDRTRDLVQSEWYQDTFRPAWRIRRSVNAKSYFANDATGWRRATSVGGGSTGHRGDVTVVDDPHDPRGAASDAERAAAVNWYFSTYWNRLNDLRTGGRVVIMQRLHEDDLTGAAIARLGAWSPDQPTGWVHLRIPAEFEEADPYVTPLGRDPRSAPGELFDPVRFPRPVLDRERKALGEVGYAAQYQQRPAPAAGALFFWERIGCRPVAPRILAAVRYWDKAGTQGGGAYTAGVLIGVDDLGRFWVLDVVRGQWSAGQREQVIEATSRADCRAYGPGRYRVYVEREGGSGGIESADNTVRRLAGLPVFADLATGSKVARARPFASQVEAGTVWMREAGWNADYTAELGGFPFGRYKDQVDASSGAFNKLAEWLAEGMDDEGPFGGGAEEERALLGY